MLYDVVVNYVLLGLKVHSSASLRADSLFYIWTFCVFCWSQA